MTNTEVIVSVELNAKTIKVGRLWLHVKSGKERASFEYDKNWLAHSNKFALEPALQLTEGSFHTKPSHSLFGAIGDSAPDRWGRVLMRRANISQSKELGNTPRTLSEIDYLLGVNDEIRQGALRFSLPEKEDHFLASKTESSVPPLVFLPKLLSATERFIDEDESGEDLKLLLAPGSSLGGARPKASVVNKDGLLSIAKFPRKDDEYNVVLWEAVALTLAKKAGIEVPSWSIESILDKPVIVINRFDRYNKTNRIPFLSAMSMLGASDNEQHSYIELVYALTKYGAEPTRDMAELWRRVVFTVMVSNTDDHLRNHGFIYEAQSGWRLSPAYDINPTPIHIKPRVLTTAIDFDNTSASLDVALSVANEFRLTHKRANEIIKEVKSSVETWRETAKSFGLAKSECDYMESAFNID